MARKARPIGYYVTLIQQEYPDFQDDGLSFFTDWIYNRWNLRLAGRVNDWFYCGRCHRRWQPTRGP